MIIIIIIIIIIASNLTSVQRSKLYVDLPSFITQSVITGDELRPDLVFEIENNIYILELTVGYETNLNSNSEREHEKYRNLIKDKEKNYNKVKFVNVSISSLGVFGKSTNSLIDMFKDLKFEEQHIEYIKRKIINCHVYPRILLYILYAKQRLDSSTAFELLS